MIFLAVLLTAYALTWLIPPRSRWTTPGRWRAALAAGMVVAGLSHLLNPLPFVQHLPPWVPARETLVYASGIVEILLGAALTLRQPARRRAGLVLAAYLVAVFPANVYVAVAGVEVTGQPGGAYPWLRLPLQLLFVWLALWSADAWPRRRPRVQRIATQPARATSAGISTEPRAAATER